MYEWRHRVGIACGYQKLSREIWAGSYGAGDPSAVVVGVETMGVEGDTQRTICNKWNLGTREVVRDRNRKNSPKGQKEVPRT